MELALAEERDNRRRASLFQADAGIHRSIAAAAHSPRLALAMNAVRADLFLPVDQDLLDSTEDEVFATHVEIVDAVRERDPARASASAATHVLRVRQLLTRALEASGLGGAAPEAPARPGAGRRVRCRSRLLKRHGGAACDLRAARRAPALRREPLVRATW